MQTQALDLVFKRVDSYSKATSKKLAKSLTKIVNKTAKIYVTKKQHKITKTVKKHLKH